MTALQAGDFILRQIPGDVGVAIEWGQRLDGDGWKDSMFEHAATVTAVHPGWVTVVEAWQGGARSHVYTEAEMCGWVTSSDLYAEMHVTQAQRDIIVACAVAHIGVPYSAADYFAIAAHRFHLPVPGLEDYIKDCGHMICSQLVDHCALAAKVHLFTDGRWEGFVTPGNLGKRVSGE